MRLARRAQEAWHRRQHPDEGLRERKRRLTRQLISDAATTMFATRGFDNVRVADVADRVGVSEKTIYNYFPTKESMVLDSADEAVERARRGAARARARRVADRRGRARDQRRHGALRRGARRAASQFMPAFVEMIEGTPALRAAWLELHDRLAKVARDELAAQAGRRSRAIPSRRSPAAPWPGSPRWRCESRVRHIRDGLRGEALQRRRCPATSSGPRGCSRPGCGRSTCSRSGRGPSARRADATEAAEDARAQVVKPRAPGPRRLQGGPPPAAATTQVRADVRAQRGVQRLAEAPRMTSIAVLGAGRRRRLCRRRPARAPGECRRRRARAGGERARRSPD